MRSGISDDELRNVISGVWIGRMDRYSEDRNVGLGSTSKKIEMYQIGG